MENEGNSLLGLPLESSEILEEVNLSSNDVDVTGSSVDNVGEMLIDEGVENNISCMESNSIDFEFVHSDLGNSSDFNIDNASVFGITDNEIDAREDCDDIFRDTACFDESNAVSKESNASTSLQSGIVSVPSLSKANLFKDLGLKLQVIPLNNLQYVSTIQTSRGLHILAIPGQTSVGSNFDNMCGQQTGQASKQCFAVDVNPSLVGHTRNTAQTKINDRPNLQENLVKKNKVEENTDEKVQASEVSLGADKTIIKSWAVSNCSQKGKYVGCRKSVIPRKSTFRRNYVKRLLAERSILKDRKSRTLYIDVVKTPNLRRRKMVSLLKASVTNDLKQAHNSACKNTSIGMNQREIKLTFHLQPNALEKKRSDNNLAKFDDKTIVTENKRNMVINNTQGTDRNVTAQAEKLHSSCNKRKVTDQVSDDTKLLDNNGAKLPEDEARTREITPSVHEAENRYKCKICLSTFSRKGHFDNHLKTHNEMISASKVNIGTRSEKNEKEQTLKQFRNKNKTIKEADKLDKIVHLSKNNNDIQTELLKCEFCGMEFKTKGNLVRHKLSHSLDTEKEVILSLKFIHSDNSLKIFINLKVSRIRNCIMLMMQ